ncbi:DNA-J related domain-containing protein [Celerinatantimonas sp. YJH-8]|uniref:DNA-J related domain-containing protein n=1 Tax=Celerinatantimonas sp. YJH-8 TaxID=3228714 RepID=UPI0038C8BC5F
MAYDFSNPLNSDILFMLVDTTISLREYDLITHLNKHLFFNSIDVPSNELRLFRRHFAVMNSLYQLRALLYPYGFNLFISSLAIKLEPIKPNQSISQALDIHDPLADYYLDWQHFNQTNEDDVLQLLTQFWRSFNRHEYAMKALQTLSLSEGATQDEITRQYRKLALQYHPDRGGDKEQFQQICDAYQKLKA